MQYFIIAFDINLDPMIENINYKLRHKKIIYDRKHQS